MLQERVIQTNCRLKSCKDRLLMPLSLRHISHIRTSCNEIRAKSFRTRESCKLSVPKAVNDPKARKVPKTEEFLREHILELAPYSSIVPFDVLSGL